MSIFIISLIVFLGVTLCYIMYSLNNDRYLEKKRKEYRRELFKEFLSTEAGLYYTEQKTKREIIK